MIIELASLLILIVIIHTLIVMIDNLRYCSTNSTVNIYIIIVSIVTLIASIIILLSSKPPLIVNMLVLILNVINIIARLTILIYRNPLTIKKSTLNYLVGVKNPSIGYDWFAVIKYHYKGRNLSFQILILPYLCLISLILTFKKRR